MTERSERDTVSFEVAGRIAWVKFNRSEKRNAMSPKLNRRMMEVIDALEFRDDVGVLVLTGEGAAWTAGMDLKEYFRETEAGGLAGTRKAQRESYGWWRRLRWYQKPTIAMVNGWCFGGAFIPLVGCDLAVAAETARFATPGVNIGLFCSTPMVALTRAVGRKAAMEMLLTGDLIGAARAREIGLVNRVVPDADLDAATDALAGSIAAKSPLTLAIGKEAFYAQAELGLADAYRHTSEVMVRNMMAADAAEGIDAFLHKRQPVWTGA